MMVDTVMEYNIMGVHNFIIYTMEKSRENKSKLFAKY